MNHFRVRVRKVSHFQSDVNTVNQACSNVMAAPTYTRCSLELPKITVTGGRRVVRASSATPQSWREKGFKFYISTYLCNF